MDRTPLDRNGEFSDFTGRAASWVLEAWSADVEARRVVHLLRRFERFCDQGFGVDSLVGVSSPIASAFVNAPGPDGATASVSLRHLRRLAIRLLFRVARSAGVEVGDPTLDLILPPRSTLATRPLTNDEVFLCRGVAQWSLSDTRRAAAWALAETSCRTAELPYVTVGDTDIEGGRVWIRGGSRTTDRWGSLSGWGREHLALHLAVLGPDPALRVLYSGADPAGAGQVSACTALQDVLTRAGLTGEPDVRASSVAAWAGRQILADTGRIDLVARGLGVRSLDRAARIIGWDWLEETEL